MRDRAHPCAPRFGDPRCEILKREPFVKLHEVDSRLRLSPDERGYLGGLRDRCDQASDRKRGPMDDLSGDARLRPHQIPCGDAVAIGDQP